ncbi:MAG: hypothetical protein H6581_03535 [Bacteroidia bacterium]|nr:hypothetical protein [Bacteroidia bacterium]
MNKFEVEILEVVQGRISFFKLKRNGKCDFDDFCEDIRKDGNLSCQVKRAFSIMNKVANMVQVP